MRLLHVRQSCNVYSKLYEYGNKYIYVGMSAYSIVVAAEVV